METFNIVVLVGGLILGLGLGTTGYILFDDEKPIIAWIGGILLFAGISIGMVSFISLFARTGSP